MKKFMFFVLVFVSVSIFVSCSSIPITDTMATQVNLSREDITLGEVLTAELPHNAKDGSIREKLIGKALKGTSYDFIFLPRYEISDSFGGAKIKVTGRGANVK